MRRTLQQQIAANRRMSLVYAGLLLLLLTALGSVTAGYYDADMLIPGAVVSFLVGIGIAVYTHYFGANTVLQISQARTATPLELQRVRNVTEEMAIAAGIPMPQVYVIEDSAPNAFATGRDPQHGVVCVTTGLLEKLDRDELQGVIAHEIAHIRNYDVRLMTTLALIAGLIPLISDFLLRSMWHGGSRGGRSRDNDNNSGQLQLIILALGLVLAILAPLFAGLLQMAVSRQREFLADSSAAELTRYPDGLASALEKIARDSEPLEAANRATAHLYICNPLHKTGEWASNLFSTHPPTDERIRRLRGGMGYRSDEPA